MGLKLHRVITVGRQEADRGGENCLWSWLMSCLECRRCVGIHYMLDDAALRETEIVAAVLTA